MAYRVEKETGDIVIDGFEAGIASSPHKGLANIQNGNISTESGEIVASFVRSQQTLQSTATGTGNLTYLSTDHVNLDIAGSNDHFKGNWITVTNSNHTGELPNGVYYVPPSTGAGFKLANYYNVSATVTDQTFNYLVVGGGGGGGSKPGGGNYPGAGGGGGAGVVTGTMSLSNYHNYTGTVGDGGTATNTGAATTFNAITGSGGGKGGNAGTPTGGAAGGAGASGGGGGAEGGTAGTATQGNAGGANTASDGGGGGGGSGSVGSSTSGNTGGAGGTGTSSSISGAAVTYGGGGGGGSYNTTGGVGNGGGGNGGNDLSNGSAGTSNRGGGGGGAGGNSSGAGATTGGKGGSGVVILSIATGKVSNPSTAAVNGTYSTSGGNDIWTFSTVGSISFNPIFATTAAPPATLSGFTAGLTANFTVLKLMGNPLAKATETYYNSGVTYYRYYILDNQNLVWVYDSFNETLYSSTDNVSWFLPDYSTSWCTSASGIGVLDGFLIATAQSGMYGKPVVNLGGTNTQTSTWAEFSTDIPWQGGASTSPHFCYVGHQGKMYITDGSYLREVFPDSTLAQTVSGTAITTTADNVQSLSSWVPNTSRNLGGFYTYGTPTSISGALPFTSDEKVLPVIFFSTGTLPAAINANQVYYINRSASDFKVLADPNMTTAGVTVVMTGTPVIGATSATLTAAWTHPTGYYVSEFTYAGGTETYNVLFTNGSTAITWGTALVHNTSTTNLHVEGILDLSSGAAGTQYFSTFYPTASAGAQDGVNPLYVLTPQRLTLPNFEVAQCMAEIGNSVMVGCKGNVVYPWDQASNLPGTIISLPEGNVQSMLTVNQTCYMFAGNQGNIYITDGSLASLVANIPDYVAGIPGSAGTYIESTYYWGDTMYLRGRVYFSFYDQSATKVGNCGGVWSLQPAQNVSIDQDSGTALRLESQNSYSTYNGYNILLIPNQAQTQEAPLYWSAWNSDVNTPTYGVDYSTNGTNASFPVIVETDAIPVGTMLNKKTISQIEYKLGTALDSGATVTAKYRQDITAAWTPCNAFDVETVSNLSGYAKANFEKGQWLQLQFTLTPITSTAATNSFIRFREIRIR